MRGPRLAIRITELGLQLLSVLLAFATAVSALLLPWVAFGDSSDSLTLDVELREPYAVVLETATPGPELVEPYVGVAPGRSLVLGNVASDRQATFPGADAPVVSFPLDLGPDDRDTRIIGTASVAALLALAWLVVVPLRRLVGDAAAGQPFHPSNPRRLRTVAAALAAGKLLTDVGLQVMDRTLDTATPVRLVDRFPGWWTTICVVVAVLALAEVFRVGADLQEADDLTV